MKTLSKLNARQIKIFGTMIIIVIMAIGYFIVISPVLDSRNQLDSTVNSSTKTLADLQAQANKLQSAANNYQANVDRNNELDKVMPSPEKNNEIAAQILQAAYNSGLGADAITNVTATTPKVVSGAEAAQNDATASAAEDEEKPTAGATKAPRTNSNADQNLASSDIVISAVGTLPQMASLLKNLEQMDRALLIDTVQFGGGSQEITMQVTGKTFVYRAGTFEVPPAPNANPTTTTDPVPNGTNPTPAPTVSAPAATQ